jgi:hypothetical protein
MNKNLANQRVWVGKGRNSAGSHWTVQTAPRGLSFWKHKAGYWQRSWGHKKAGLRHILGTGSSSFYTNKTQTSKKIKRSVRWVENDDNEKGRCWTLPLQLQNDSTMQMNFEHIWNQMLIEINMIFYCNLWATPSPPPLAKDALQQQHIL